MNKNNKDIKNAAALLYNREVHNAPILISKGSNYLAKRMVDIARKHKVPVVSNEDTAKHLMQLEIGEEIPYSLYEAVSIILKYIYKLKAE
ncbi:EscU/YscU/HrcU family type III secretion system export apparatus switch protein [Brachyspira hampsonii]|uniref:Flagellar biosynthesis protein FlhB n=1 Tax=Brachyspira hampsonii TaxID=1287055 RepID=A0AAC9XKP5_9SPIR|nr:EscU/YscU/HrcU family type III secretion system export apparatus switch protein [Brachyspira hampsonii]ASJ21686.1 flagellar biosynthesis protein FlhB [Brachyspira hampsonii]ELV06968.1 flagellar biosynthesis protein flhB [Brachyspira hampsonii 30599]MBW5379125.1 flagellar biosynthesis protein FlhB [Brachyspira hampsonii]MBW5410601.1 flagellar biosynthesis protein FlhB [Brachyspira hampsonii]OEJ18859.1 flagellar biosynthesis protein FlhB [Brachyspira hampsonii]